jgi:two-component system sensor histidine kinase YesM
MNLRFSFFSRLLMAFIFIGVIPLIIIGFISYSVLTDSLMNTISNQAYNNVAKISEHIDRLNSEYGEIIIYLLKEDELILNALIKGTREDYDVIYKKILVMAGRKNTGFFIINTTGSVIFSTHSLPSHYDPQVNRDRGIFKEMDSKKNGYIIYPHHYTNSSGDNIVYSIGRSLRDEKDHIIGYIIIDIYKTHIVEICDNFNTQLNLDLLVLNHDFLTIANLRKPKGDGELFSAPYLKRIKNEGKGLFIFKDHQQLIAFYESKYSRMIVVGVMPIAIILENSNFIKWITILTCLASLTICVLLAVLITRNISQPIKKLVYCMNQVEKGDLSAKADYQRWDEFGILGKSYNNMIDRIKELLGKIVDKQNQLREYEIKALQAQINPHFLYNTLDSIKWLAKMNGVNEISLIATQLGKLLRSSISYNGELLSVEESINNIKSYLNIQKIRYSGKFDTSFQIDPEIKDCLIPKLILQPLVENAVLHGLENKEGKGLVSINGYKKGNDLIFEIIDDGVGIDAEKVKAINAGHDFHSSSASIGIQNINRRVKLYYGDEYGLLIESEKNKGTKIILKMPIVIPPEGKRDVQDSSS